MKTIPSSVQMAKDLVEAYPHLFKKPQLAICLIAEALMNFHKQCEEYVKEPIEFNELKTAGINLSTIDE